jgi:hypothetical protein
VGQSSREVEGEEINRERRQGEIDKILRGREPREGIGGGGVQGGRLGNHTRDSVTGRMAALELVGRVY